MDSLVEAASLINLNYALPVAGVLLLIALIFTFGFKSAAQLPAEAFSSGDQDRKTKKSKKTAKKLSQNGHVSSISEPTPKHQEKSNAKQTQSPKQKNAKAAAPTRSAEATKNNKVDIKNKKNEKNEKNAQKKKKDEILNKKSAAAGKQAKESAADGSGEWVQLVSRKDKRGRKKEIDGGDNPKELIGSSKEGTPEKKRSVQPKSQENSPKKSNAAQKEVKKNDNEVKKEPVKKENTKKLDEKENVKPAQGKEKQNQEAKVKGSPETKKNKTNEIVTGGIKEESGDATVTKKKKARRDH